MAMTDAGTSQHPLPPLALYVHVPWCVVKCPYCDFNSHPKRGELPEDAYVTALIEDLQQEAPDVQGRNIETVFIGGGTPSLLTPDAMQRILSAAAEHIGIADDAEITMEANPGAIEYFAFDGYLEAGINRLSLGVQSFADEQLRRLGRVHDSRAAGMAYAEARAAGFNNINLDLMYGLPGQTVSEALHDIEVALELAPDHLSHYHLTMEPGTAFGRKPPEDLPDDDQSWKMLSEAGRLLGTAGYQRYEISAYAREGRQCRHNLNYWRFGDYLGIGAGAHGKLTLADGSIERTERPAKPARYLATDKSARRHTNLVSDTDRAFEYMLNGLRLTGGFRIADFEARTGLSAPAAIGPGLREAGEKGLLTQKDTDLWQPTDLGIRFLDDLQQLFLP